jgi:hypothetical protein
MRLASRLFAATLVFAASTLAAKADTFTYTIVITQIIIGGSASGSISGTGTSITGFDVAASDGTNAHVFDSSVAGERGFFLDTNTTLQDGTPGSDTAA